jgi:hypothetical protein
VVVQSALAPTAVPGVPFIQAVTGRALGISVSWAPSPASDAVTAYRVVAKPSPTGQTPPPRCTAVTVTVPLTNSAAVVGGLCEAVAYVATVAATNAVGTSAESSISSPAVPGPISVPSAPQVTGVFARPAGLAVSWAVPIDDGGSPLTGYRVTAKQGSTTVTTTVAASALTATQSGLANGAAASVTVVAVNARGASAAGTTAVTPAAAPKPTGPRDFTVTPGSGGAVAVTWSAPEDAGGLAVNQYAITYQQVVPDASGTTWTPAPGTSPQTVTTPGTSTSVTIPAITPATALYSFAIAATTAAGTGLSVSAPAPVSPTTSLGADTVVLTTATMTALSDADSSSLTWAAPAPAQITDLTAGRILVGAPSAAAPRGLLRTVVGIEHPSAGTYRVLTTPAALPDAFTALALSKTLNPLTVPGTGPLPGGARFRPAVPGVRVMSPALSVTVSAKLTLGIERKAGGASVNGEATLEPQFTVGLNLNRGFLGVPNGVRIQAAAEIGTELNATIAITEPSPVRWKVGEIPAPPVVITAGPVLIVLFPIVDVFFSISGRLGFTLRDDFSVGASLDWNSAKPDALTVRNLSQPSRPDGGVLPELTVTGSGTAAIGPEPTLRFYDLAGPYFAYEFSAEAALNPAPAPGSPYLTITPKVAIKAGLKLDLFGKHTEVETSLGTELWPALAVFPKPGPTLLISPADPSVMPGTTRPFFAQRSDGATGHPVTWSLQGAAGDAIGSTGVLTVVAPTDRQLIVRATDDTGAQGIATVTVGAVFDAPRNVTAVQHAQDDGATVSWSAPASTGGSPLSSYTVVTDPPTGPYTVSAAITSLNLTGLEPGTTYFVSVYATNTAGAVSGPGSASLKIATRPSGCPVALTLGSTTQCSLVRANQIATFTIAVTAGDRLRLHGSPTASGKVLALSISLISPNGSVVCSAPSAGDFDCAVPATGTYAVTVRDFFGTGTGPYAITPQRLNNPVGCGNIALAATTTGTLALGATPCHRIAATAGDRLRLHTVSTSQAATAPATATDLISPSGAVVCSAPSAGDLDCTVPTTGSYTATVSDYYGWKTGPYAITPQRLNNPVGCGTIAIGGTASGTLGLGTVSCYRVTSTAGRILKIVVSTTQLSPMVDLVSPTGILTCPATLGTATCTTPAAGIYTLTVGDFYGSQTGPFTLAVS